MIDNVLTKRKKEIISLSILILFLKLKELFDLIISEISSDGGDFPRIIEIALLRLLALNLIEIEVGFCLFEVFWRFDTSEVKTVTHKEADQGGAFCYCMGHIIYKCLRGGG